MGYLTNTMFLFPTWFWLLLIETIVFVYLWRLKVKNTKEKKYKNLGLVLLAFIIFMTAFLSGLIIKIPQPFVVFLGN